MTLLYLAGLLVGIAGMIVLDVRFGLFFRRSPVRAATVMVLGIAFFLIWDVLGIRLEVFFPGPASIVTGVMLAPGLPLEEVFFLTLLCYTAMNAYGWFTRPRPARKAAA
ncbi:lycopene cyclase domain-containing protein [Pseudolysinimonas sp.]|uniref:lycopene cyclase domain-containing protein n=1 Tax=Pseudolysinimonas sp. TaxID=2680009 RepID=UPI003F7EEFDD